MSAYHLHARRGLESTHTEETEDLDEVQRQAAIMCAKGWYVWIFHHEPLPEVVGLGAPRTAPPTKTFAEYRPGEKPIMYGFEGLPPVTRVGLKRKVA